MRYFISRRGFAPHLDNNVFVEGLVDDARREEKDTVSTGAPNPDIGCNSAGTGPYPERRHGAQAFPLLRKRRSTRFRPIQFP
jgi:hypothetical protein